jgi:hypothetical protein
MTIIDDMITIIKNIDEMPDFLKENGIIIKECLRLYYLLYEKDANYEGPLYDGLQKNDWTMILFLLTNWLVESIHDISKIKFIQIKQQIAYNKLIHLAIIIIKKFIENNIISIDETEKPFVLLLLENKQIIDFVQDQLYNFVNKINNCCTNTKSIQKLTNETGNKCTFINKLKTIQP